jgi:hypothetical protein
LWCFPFARGFRRFTFHLIEDSVSLALHSVLGGTHAGFHVTYLKDCHYRFSVASKQVGLMIYTLKRIISGHFDVYFHLWRDGGELDQIMEKMARGRRSVMAAGFSPQTSA